MAKYMVLKAITLMHGRTGVSEEYAPGTVVELEGYNATTLLDKGCIQPAALNKRQGIIKLKELKHDTDG